MYSEKQKLHKRQSLYKVGNLRTIALDVTPNCNMNCPHCYAETFRNVTPIGLDVLEKVLSEAYEMGVLHYILQGGEPLTDLSRLEAILQMCSPDETYINIVSNGWDMNLENILWLRDRKVDKIAFSLDSGVPEEHDRNRRKGSHQRVLEAVDNVLEAGMLASISTVVTHESLYSEGFKVAYEYARNKGIRLDVQIAMPVGKWDARTDFLMTVEDSEYIKHLRVESPTLANGQRLINRDIFNYGGADHCPAGVEFMALTADGEFLPCNFLQYSLGNIRSKSLAKMRGALLTCDWFQGKQPNCICGENQDFIKDYVVPYANQRKPVDAFKVFNLQEEVACEKV